MLAEGVQRMPCLETLNLRDNSRIGCGGAVQLVSSLHSSELRELNMSGTGISDPDFECLASYIHSTTSLQRLSIRRNDISVESIDSLCKALSANSSELGLWHNQIRSEGAVAIATMLKTNSSLERLYLDECSIGSSGGVELGRALERNKTLRELLLSGNALGDDGVRGLSEGLETNSSLEELVLVGDESLGEEGVSLLLKCVEEKNTSLKELWLPVKYKSIALRTKGWVN